MIHGFMSIELFSQRRDALNGTSKFLNAVLQSSKSLSEAANQISRTAYE
jgi:hypothetical protein